MSNYEFWNGSLNITVQDDNSYVQYPSTTTPSRNASGMIAISYANCPSITGGALNHASSYEYSIGMDVYINEIYPSTFHVLSSISVYIRDASDVPQQYHWNVYFWWYYNAPVFYSGLVNSSSQMVKAATITLSGINIEGWQKFRFTITDNMPTNSTPTFGIEYYNAGGVETFQNMASTLTFHVSQGYGVGQLG